MDLDLCDSLLESLYNSDKIKIFNNNDNDNDDDDKCKDIVNEISIWKKYRTRPKIVLEKAVASMSEDQKRFFNLVTNDDDDDDDKQIYMLAGLPGTGKSFLQTCIHLFFKILGKDVLCLAPTNLIAYQQKGMTIHRAIYSICKALKIKQFKCDNEFITQLTDYKYYNIYDMSLTKLCHCIEELILKSQDNNNNNKFNKFQKINSKDIVILIDEGSMVSSTLFSLLFYTYPNAKYVIMYGPNQLPPPVSSGGINIPSCDFCIKKEDDYYSRKILFYELVSQMRFNSKNSVFIKFVQYFSDVLSKKENTTITEKLNVMEYFLDNLKIGGNLKEYKQITNDPQRILIVSTNAQRCLENSLRLKNEGEGPIYEIRTEKPPELPPSYDLPSRIGIDDTLKIRKGVYCMIRMNMLSNNLIKGQIIKIVDIIMDIENENNVKFIVGVVIKDNNNNNHDNNNKIILEKIEIPTDFHIQENYLTVKQFPITLSYSLTAHSAQGKTLDCNIGIDLLPYNNDININSYFVAITRVRESKQIYMDFHPVYLLFPSLNIKTVNDIEKLREKVLSSPSVFINYVNSFKTKKFYIDDDEDEEDEDISYDILQNTSKIIKKICRL